MAEAKSTSGKSAPEPGPQPGQDEPPGTSEHLGSDRPYEGAPYPTPEDKRGN